MPILDRLEIIQMRQDAQKLELLRAYTSFDPNAGPSLILEFKDMPPAVVDLHLKRPVVAAGAVLLFFTDPDVDLSGTAAFRLRVHANDPGSEIVCESAYGSAWSRAPLVLDLVRAFLASTDDL